MSHTTEIIPTWSWLRATSRELFELQDELPPLSFEFPFEKFIEAIKQAFHLANFSLEKGEAGVRAATAFTSGIGGNVRSIHVKAAGVAGSVTLLLPEILVDTLMAEMLEISTGEVETLPDDFKTVFFRFITAETLVQLNQSGFQKLTFVQTEEVDEEVADYAIDIFVHVGNARYLTRLIVSQEFQIALHNKSPQPLSEKRLSALDLRLHVLAGRTALRLSDLTKVQPGDFLAIDQPFYDPEHDPKSCYITLQDRVLFRAEIQGPHLTIQEIPSHTEVNNTMPQKLNMESDATHDPHPVDSDDEDAEDIFKDESDVDDDDHDDYELQEGGVEKAAEEETQEEVVAEEKEPPKETIKAPKVRAPISRGEHPIAGGKVTLQDIAVTVNIELAEVDISAQKLIELQPGSVLDLQSDGSTVLLVVNNKIIGKGEVIKIGSTLGVRILELGAE